MPRAAIPALRTTPLQSKEITHVSSCVLRRENRELLDATDFAKIKASSLNDFPVQYVEVKLASISGAHLSEHHLKATASLSYINQLVATRFEKFDLLELFQEFPLIDPQVGWISTTPTIDLFSAVDTVTIDMVKQSVAWMRKNIDVELTKTVNEYDRDLDWSREILLRACDINLSEIIMCEEKELTDIDRGFTGGPITFMLIMNKLSSLTSDGLYDLYKHIQSLDVKNYDGEHIPSVTKEIRLALKRLESCSKDRFVLPPTMMDDLIKVLQTTSCEEFNNTFKTLKIHQNIFGQKLTSMELLELADKTYKQLESSWKGPIAMSNNQHGFVTTPQQQNTDQANKQSLGPEWFQPPDPKNKSCRQVSDDPSRWTKKIGHQIVHWCGKCQNRKTKNKGRWTNGDYRHFTDEHKTREKTATPPTVQAHLAGITATTPSSASSVISEATTQQHSNTLMSFTEAIQQMTPRGN